MAHFWQDFDEFTDNSPAPGDRYLHGEYMRWRAWSGSKSLAFSFGTHSVTCGIGTLTDAYAALPRGYLGPYTLQRSTPLGAAAWTCQTAEAGRMMCVLSRRHWVLNGTTSATIQYWEHLSPATSGSVKFAGVACRVQGQSFSEDDALSGTGFRHAYSDLGSGYIFSFFNDGSTRGLALLRVIGPGVVTVLASSLEATPYFADATLMSITAINSGASVRLTCRIQYDPTVQPILSSSEQEKIVFDYLDSSPGVLIGAGRCGVVGSSTPSSGVSVLTMVRSFKIDDVDYGAVVHEDEWQRADPAMCWLFDSATGLDSNQLAGRSMHSRYAHDSAGAMAQTATGVIDQQPARCRTVGDRATVPNYYDTTGWGVSGSYSAEARYFDNRKLADPNTTDRLLRCRFPFVSVSSPQGFWLIWRGRFVFSPTTVGIYDNQGYWLFVRSASSTSITLNLYVKRTTGTFVSLAQSLPFSFGKYNFLYGVDCDWRIVATTVLHPTYGTSMQMNLYINGVRFEDWNILSTSTVKSEPSGLIVHGTSYQAGLDMEGFVLSGTSLSGVVTGSTATLWGRQEQVVVPTVTTSPGAAMQAESCGAATGQVAGCTTQSQQVG